jgi:hypothetical protein
LGVLTRKASERAKRQCENGTDLHQRGHVGELLVQSLKPLGETLQNS